MPAFKNTFKIENGLINFDLFSIQIWASIQADGNYTISINEKRTLSQNKILHVLIEEFRQWMIDSQGETWDSETAKYMFKIWSGYYTKHIQKLPKGGVKLFRIPKESSAMGKKKFCAWMKYVKQKWYNDFGYESRTLLDRETAVFLGI